MYLRINTHMAYSILREILTLHSRFHTNGQLVCGEAADDAGPEVNRPGGSAIRAPAVRRQCAGSAPAIGFGVLIADGVANALKQPCPARSFVKIALGRAFAVGDPSKRLFRAISPCAVAAAMP
jgi:hypothetical protein